MGWAIWTRRGISSFGLTIEITESSFGLSYTDSTGRTLPMFNLPKDLTTTRADVLWFAENSNSVLEIPEHLSHPQSIRQWHRDQQAILENSDPVLKEGPVPVGVAEKYTKNPRGYHEESPQRPPPLPPLGFSK